jgi:polygalacturonase
MRGGNVRGTNSWLSGKVFAIFWVSGSLASVPAAVQTPPHAGQNTPSVCNVRDYGAVGDDQTLDTHAISKAIEACAQAGGGVVVFPPGRYVTRTFELRSNITLFLDGGAVIVGSRNLEDYGKADDYGFGRDYGVNSTGEGFKVGIIIARNLQNVAIVGRGAIDGGGDGFMDLTVAHFSYDFDPQ